MRDEGSHNALLNFLNRIGGWILTLTALLSGLYGTIKLIQGDIGLVTILCLVVAVAAAWLTALYCYFSKVIPKKAVGFRKKTSNEKQYRYSKETRRLAFVCIFAIPLVTGVGVLTWRHIRNL